MTTVKPTTDSIKLTDVQKHALLLVGGLSTLGNSDSNGGINIAKRTRNPSASKWYWGGLHYYFSKDKSRNVVIRLKTFKSLESKGLLSLYGGVLEDRLLSRSNLSRNDQYRKAMLTSLGWEVFDALAREHQSLQDTWKDKLEKLTAEECQKGQTYVFQMRARRKIKVVQFQEATVEVSATANTEEEALAIAEKEFDNLPQSRFYWLKLNEPDEVWGDGAEKEAATQTEVVNDRRSINSRGVRYAETPVRRAERRLLENGKRPAVIEGVEEYVKHGERAAELRQLLVEGFGGRILDMDFNGTTSGKVEKETGIDYNRFQHIMDDD